MTTLGQPPEVPRLPVHRFTVAEYHEMIAAGILDEDDNVELLHGWIVPKMSRNPPHDAVLGITLEALRARLPAAWRIRVQSAITTADSEPEPDLAVVRAPLSRYFAAHPTARDIGLVIEVADSSLERDRHEKGPIYAAAGIAHYWILNVVNQSVEIYSDPSASGYQTHADFTLGHDLSLVLDGQQAATIPVHDLFAGSSFA
jgi:Uma2 family endonuclease